ncbi:outer membrane protein assembly factor BamB family protein [Draconibacterium sediminis]|uniref:outer membrane protein assembly factor BamB family protein n=1 Tax=Draconibacterium sediminis TaxID=1544798 RepID=UPI000697D811|nr:PQQ-binding-like beta-propeller repeat protein [Draconibacterium sediminis]
MNRVLIILSLNLLFFVSEGAVTKGFEGHVFDDINKSGTQDKNEKGIAGIKVSDGFNVVVTDKNGRFILPGWKKSRFITVYQPSNYSCNDWYLPISEKRKDYDFAMSAKRVRQKVNFVQISDTETFEYKEWVNNVREYADVNQSAFIVHTGDICYKRGMRWHSENITSNTMGVPVYYCLGNHDMVEGQYGEQFYEKCFGPAWYAFEEGNTLFVVTPMMRGDHKPSFTHEDIGRWLKALLGKYESAQPKIIFNHDLLTDDEHFVFQINKTDSINFNNYNLKAWLYGHWHNNMVKNHGGNEPVISYGTAVAAKGGIDHSPSSYRVVNIDENGNISSTLRWTYVNRKIEVVAPIGNDLLLKDDSELGVSVNIYHSGAEVQRVNYRIWVSGDYPDWHDLDDLEHWKTMQQSSDWNWQAQWSVQDYQDGEYTLTVNAFLKGGEVLVKQVPFTLNRKSVDANKGDNWINFLGNAMHNRHSNASTEAPKLVWSTNLGSNIYMTSPVIYDDKVFMATFDDNNAENCAIVGLNAISGEIIWRYQPDNSIKNTLVVAKGIVVATDMQGITYALNTKSGELVWKKDLGYNRLPGFVSGLVTDGEIIYTGFGSSLCAIKVEDGSLIWKNEAWNGGEGSVPTMTLADGVLVTSSHWRALYGHNALTGKLLWTRKDEGLRYRDGTLSYNQGSLWATIEDKLVELDVKTGVTKNVMKTGMRHAGNSTPVLADSLWILGSAHPGIGAFDRNTSSRKWIFEVEPAIFYTPSYFSDNQQSIESSPLILCDKVFFGAMDGNIYLLNSESGKLIWKKSLGVPVMSSAASNENQVYVADFAGNVYCFYLN